MTTTNVPFVKCTNKMCVDYHRTKHWLNDANRLSSSDFCWTPFSVYGALQQFLKRNPDQAHLYPSIKLDSDSRSADGIREKPKVKAAKAKEKGLIPCLRQDFRHIRAGRADLQTMNKRIARQIPTIHRRILAKVPKV